MSQLEHSKPADDLEGLYRFVAEFCGVERSRVQPDTRLGEDLGVDGDDASELMTEFSRRYRVDLSGFRFEDHFGSEGPAILGLIWGLVTLNLKNPARLKPVTMADMETAAREGRWKRSN